MTNTPLQFTDLTERPDAIPLIARWWHDEWGYLRPERSLAERVQQVRESARPGKLPIRILALDGDEVAGVAALKLHEMEELYPDRRYWLGSVFVAPAARGRGIGSALAAKIASLAADRGVTALHLQTQRLDGGFYARLGWQPLEQVRYRGYDALVMVKLLSS